MDVKWNIQGYIVRLSSFNNERQATELKIDAGSTFSSSLCAIAHSQHSSTGC
jgi:hypothetical protein